MNTPPRILPLLKPIGWTWSHRIERDIIRILAAVSAISLGSAHAEPTRIEHEGTTEIDLRAKLDPPPGAVGGSPPPAPSPAVSMEMLTTQIKVADHAGKPVARATITVEGLRTRANPGSYYSWWPPPMARRFPP